MDTQAHAHHADRAGLAWGVPLVEVAGDTPEGLLVSGAETDEGRIAVVYRRGDTPPEITICDTADKVQTILADGVAVAVVARAEGPRLTKDDVLLVERFVAARS